MKKKKVLTEKEIAVMEAPVLISTLEDMRDWLNDLSHKLNPMEKVMATNLLLKEYPFYAQHKINLPEGWKMDGRTYFLVDFYIPALKVVIETDGKIHSELSVQTKDINKNNALVSMGYRVFHFTWDEVMENKGEDYSLFHFIENLMDVLFAEAKHES